VVGEVEQTEFDEVLTTGSNSVILPAFTDDWGNSVAIGDRTFSVSFGGSLPIPRNYWKMDANVAGEIIDEQGNDNLIIVGTPTVDSSGMFINSSTDGAYTDGTYNFMDELNDWSLEYNVLVRADANTFSGNFHVGKKAAFPEFVGMRYGGNDVESVFYGKQHAHTIDDRVLTWKSSELVIPVKIVYNKTTKLVDLTVNGELYSGLSTSSSFLGYNEFHVAMQSSDASSFTPSTATCIKYKFSEIKYYDQQIL
jgi:hypothetical protein